MKKQLLIFLCLAATTIISGQQNNSVESLQDTTGTAVRSANDKRKKDIRPWKERIAFGGGTSFWITPGQTYLELSPVVAYRFPKTLVTGAGYRYIYRHERVIGNDLNAYGPSFFARINLLKRLYLWTEYEYLNNEYFYQAAGEELARYDTHSDSWFAGLGYIRSIGKKGRGGVSIQVLYNFLYTRDEYSPYYAPVTYRVGYYF
ncbi:MAG: hypothetical protein MUE32_04500 [Bacteroidales bacterium]|jgi:hypothetical protein|nr:hypothetical protein [Bacteroidales bacterium]